MEDVIASATVRTIASRCTERILDRCEDRDGGDSDGTDDSDDRPEPGGVVIDWGDCSRPDPTEGRAHRRR